MSNQLAVAVLTKHRIECTGPGEVTCRECRSKSWMSWHAYYRHIVEALDAEGLLITPPTADETTKEQR